MTVGLTGCTLALDHTCVLAGWCQQSQLIEGQHFTASLGDSLASAFGDAESANLQFWNLKETDIIGDGSDNDDDLTFLGLTGLDQAADALERDDWSVNA